LQKLRCILIRLSIRAGTGIEPFKTKAYTGGREIGFGGLVPIPTPNIEADFPQLSPRQKFYKFSTLSVDFQWEVVVLGREEKGVDSNKELPGVGPTMEFLRAMEGITPVEDRAGLAAVLAGFGPTKEFVRALEAIKPMDDTAGWQQC
jgi:hypothetical protein